MFKTTAIDTLKQDKKCQACWYMILSTMSGSTTSRDSFVKQPPDSISSSIVNSQTRYNSNGKINAVPILVYHNITNTIMDYIIPSHASSTTLDLFAQEMKYLHDNGFRVLLLNQVGYDSHSRNLYRYVNCADTIIA